MRFSSKKKNRKSGTGPEIYHFTYSPEDSYQKVCGPQMEYEDALKNSKLERIWSDLAIRTSPWGASGHEVEEQGAEGEGQGVVRPKGGRYMCPRGNIQTQVIQMRPEKTGLILRLFKEHSQPVLVTF